MRPKSLQCRAITLTELLISTTVVGIIMLGVISSDYAIRKQSDNASAGALAALNGQGMLKHIIDNAGKAVGDKSLPGINYPNDKAWFCIRQDINKTPIDFADDAWICYTVVTGNLYNCAKQPPAASPSACADTDTLLGQVQGIDPSFSLNNNIFSVTVTIADPTAPGGQRSWSASVSPSGHTI